ncbi:MAG: hypothetical protein KF787_13730 [Phycisphaeraceae bacterium]|nr:hypothetical protein [Phycisphaerae bacterium]MBX3393695.1 hypothetical protein [Phycisphaeraceae bacterium]
MSTSRINRPSCPSRRVVGSWRGRWRSAAGGLGLVLGVLLAAGCESADKSGGGSARWTSPGSGGIPAGGGSTGSSRSFVVHPFDPASMRVHPLTHMQRTQDVAGAVLGSDGKSPPLERINVFVEFKDRWGDTCKALGLLQVQLYRSSSEAGQERQEATWDADLSDLEKNADWFDPVTRAYRLQLQVPGWLGDLSGQSSLKLRVVFTPSSGDDPPRRLRTDFVVTRS